jgi:hypothetical protein
VVPVERSRRYEDTTMVGYTNELLVRDRIDSLQREAERERVIRIVRAARPNVGIRSRVSHALGVVGTATRKAGARSARPISVDSHTGGARL